MKSKRAPTSKDEEPFGLSRAERTRQVDEILILLKDIDEKWHEGLSESQIEDMKNSGYYYRELEKEYAYIVLFEKGYPSGLLRLALVEHRARISTQNASS